MMKRWKEASIEIYGPKTFVHLRSSNCRPNRQIASSFDLVINSLQQFYDNLIIFIYKKSENSMLDDDDDDDDIYFYYYF